MCDAFLYSAFSSADGVSAAAASSPAASSAAPDVSSGSFLPSNSGSCIPASAKTSSSGGTDFIAVAVSERLGVDAWNYILLGNAAMLAVTVTLSMRMFLIAST